jgi:NADH:ubiquinone oxidoreductase subunit C
MSAEEAPPAPPLRDLSEVRASAEEMRAKDARLIMIMVRENPDGTFELIYAYDLGGCVQDVRFSLPPDREVDTISGVYAGATNLEREIVDLFGLNFKGMAPGLLLEAGKSMKCPLRRPPEPKPEGPPKGPKKAGERKGGDDV